MVACEAVLDIVGAMRMKRALLDSHHVIVVVTMQDFRRKGVSSLDVDEKRVVLVRNRGLG